MSECGLTYTSTWDNKSKHVSSGTLGNLKFCVLWIHGAPGGRCWLLSFFSIVLKDEVPLKAVEKKGKEYDLYTILM